MYNNYYEITIFIIVFVLKSNENMEIWHFRLSQLANSSKPCKNSLFEDVFKVFAPCSSGYFTAITRYPSPCLRDVWILIISSTETLPM